MRKFLVLIMMVMFMFGAMNTAPIKSGNVQASGTVITNSVVPGDGGGYPTNPAWPGYNMGTWLCNTYDYNVEQLQYRLSCLGYSTSGVDGYYGTNTKNAVWNYQYWHGLTVDGVCGQETWNDIFQ